MTEELKPCPLCGCLVDGEQPYLDSGGDHGNDYWIIQCFHCKLMIYNQDKDKVIESWNRRISDGNII